LWNTLKAVGYHQKCNSKEPVILNVNDVLCHDPVSITEHVNGYFINIAQNLVNALPLPSDSFHAFSENCRNYYRSMGITPGAF
jgi:hypothetical protein